MARKGDPIRELGIEAALAMYVGEPCRICGFPIRSEEAREAVFAGYAAGNVSRAANGACWRKGMPQ